MCKVQETKANQPLAVDPTEWSCIAKPFSHHGNLFTNPSISKASQFFFFFFTHFGCSFISAMYSSTLVKTEVEKITFKDHGWFFGTMTGSNKPTDFNPDFVSFFLSLRFYRRKISVNLSVLNTWKNAREDSPIQK